jgi:hypothetical protein
LAPRADEGRGRRRNASGSCEQALLPGDVRMGKPTQGNAWVRPVEYIGRSRKPRELKHLSTSRNRKYSVSSGERKRRSPNRGCVIGRSRCSRGVVGPDSGICETRRELQIELVSGSGMERPAEEGDSPVCENHSTPDRVPEYHVEGLSCGKPGGPPSKAKYSWRPIAN